jgi:sugar fermentation stimulation protein A
MKFPDPLIRGTLVKRYKRFLADVQLESGGVVTAHCANPGSMLTVDAPGSEVWLSPSRNPERKLKYSWELIRVGKTLVGINTGHPNALVEEALRQGEIAELTGYGAIRREVKYGKNSRIDLLLEGNGRPTCYVEVKNVTMRRDLGADGPTEFPDAVTARGAKHLEELTAMVGQGARAAMLFLAQREDSRSFTVAGDIDPAYAEGLSRARAAGVEVLCYGCRVGVEEIRVDRPLALAL